MMLQEPEVTYLSVAPVEGVRLATQADEAALYDCLISLYSNNFLGFSMSPTKVWGVIRQCCRGQGGLCGIIEEGDQIVATTGIIFNTMFYSDDPFLSELWLYVRPTCRNKGYADDLAHWLMFIRDQIRSSDNGRALPLITSVTSFHRLPAKLRWWRRWARTVGGIFVIDGA